MNNCILILSIILLGTLSSIGQKKIIFTDSTSFTIFEKIDTIKISTSGSISEFDSISYDLNCDGIRDIFIKCFKEPINNLPPYNFIEIENLNSSSLEFLFDQPILFSVHDTINLNDVVNWSSRSKFKILSFNVIGGATWLGNVQSSMIKNKYLAFRYLIDNEYKYGWIDFSARAYPAEMYIHSTAIEVLPCTSSNQKFFFGKRKTVIFPNPFTDYFNLELDLPIYEKTEWRITCINGNVLIKGIVNDKKIIIPIENKLVQKGIYIFQILIDRQIVDSQLVIYE